MIKKYVKGLIIVILLVFAVFNFVRAGIDLVKNKARLKDLEKEVEILEKEKVVLEDKVTYESTDSFIEESARNDLNMVKPNERVFVIVDKGNSVQLEESKLEESVKYSKNRSNIEQWFSLFFDSSKVF